MYKKLSLVLALLLQVCAASGVHVDSYGMFVDYRNVMTELYGDVNAIISQEERETIAKTGGSPVYGEILFESVQYLLHELDMSADDVFYDLGSGLGRFVIQVYLSTPAQKSIGVEFSPSRYERATSVEAKAKKLQPVCYKFENAMRKQFGKEQIKKTRGKMFEFNQGDMLDTDLSDATVVFTCSTCFTDDFMRKLTDKLGALEDGVRLVTLRQLPQHDNIHLKKTYMLPMTWSPETPVYYYEIDRSSKATAEEAAKAQVISPTNQAPQPDNSANVCSPKK